MSWVVVLVGLVARIARYLACWPLFGDEAFVAVNLLVRDFAGLARPLEYFQIAPVGFLWAELVVVRLLGPGELALRLLPCLAGIGSVLLFRQLATARLAPRAALLAVALFATSFYPIRHATEVKPYSTDLLLALILTAAAIRTSRTPDALKNWLGLGLVGSLGVWFSYPLIFVAGGTGLALLAVAIRTRSWRVRLGWAGVMLATIVSWAIMYAAVAKGQSDDAPFYRDMPTWEDSFPPLDRPWEIPWWLVRVHSGNMLAYPYGGNNFGSLITLILVTIGAVVLWRRDRRLLEILIAPIAPALAAAALHRYPYGTSPRISLFLAPAICLLAGQGLATLFLLGLGRPRARRAIAITTIGLALAAIVVAIGSIERPYMSPIDVENRRVARSLAARSRSGDRWIGFNGIARLPKLKQLMLMPWLQHLAEFHFYTIRDVPGPLVWNPRPESVALVDGPTWLVVHEVGYDRFPREALGELFQRLYDRLGPPEIDRVEPIPGESITAYRFRQAGR